MQADPRYDDVVSEVKAFLDERLAFAVSEGIREGSSASTRESASGRRTSTTSSSSAGCPSWRRSGAPW